MAKRDDILEALSGKTKCEKHGDWLEEGERCGRCVIENAPTNLLNTLMGVAFEKKQIDTQELVTNVMGSLMFLNEQSNGGLLRSLLPAKRVQPLRRRVKKRARRVRNTVPRQR